MSARLSVHLILNIREYPAQEFLPEALSFLPFRDIPRSYVSGFLHKSRQDLYSLYSCNIQLNVLLNHPAILAQH